MRKNLKEKFLEKIRGNFFSSKTKNSGKKILLKFFYQINNKNIQTKKLQYKIWIKK